LWIDVVEHAGLDEGINSGDAVAKPLSEPEMAHWIQHVCEPSRLLLAWQAPDPAGDRTRFAVAERVPDGADCILRYIAGPDMQGAKELGFVGYPAFNFDQSEQYSPPSA
jgi:hypothetical protein